jgi:hypothetical protein
MGLISYTKIKDGDNATGNLFNAPLETLYNEFNGNIGSVNIQNSAITGAKIADSTITPAKLDLTQKFTFITTETTTSTATLTPTTSKDMYILTAQAAGLTIAAPTGTPLEGQALILRIKDNGTARALSWNAAYRAVGVELPTTTVINKVAYIGALWNSTESKWDVIAVAIQE